MKNELNFEIFRRAFSSRIEVASAVGSALQPPSNNLDRLKTAVSGLEVEVSKLGQGEVENQYRAYLAGVGLFAVLAEWKHALRNAEPDAQRFISSARIKASEMDVTAAYDGDTKRAILEVAHSFGSRPYEFKYAAEFDDTSSSRKVAIVGHRQLRLEGADVASNPLTGFSNVDRHLLGLRDRLRSFPGLHPTDLANTMVVLGGLGNIAAQALKQGTFIAGTTERLFQEKATELLRNRAEIGENLQGHQEAAGGITDLTFMDIPIELKVENKKVLYPKDFQKYFDQTAAYALGLGKRIGVLAVLETSKKAAPVGTPEDDIEFLVHQVGQSVVAIVVVVVRGGFPKPSAYSKGVSSKKRS